MILMLRPLGLGDFLTGVPSYRAIARAFPDERVVLAAPQALAPLARCCGAIDEVVDTRPLEPLDDALRCADIAVDLHGRGPASQEVLLAASPRELVSFANDDVEATAGFPEWRADEHEVSRWCRMLSESGIPSDPSDLDIDVPEWSPARDVAGATLVHPGAGSASRCWPLERWVSVVRHERVEGRRVIVTGDMRERSCALKIAAIAGLRLEDVFAGRTTLEQLAALVRSAGRVICSDTGVAHLATALRTPSVLLFGPTSPAHWGPPTDRPWHHVLWAGDTGDPHGTVTDRGLLRIGAYDVLRELDALALAPPPFADGATHGEAPCMKSA